MKINYVYESVFSPMTGKASTMSPTGAAQPGYL